MTKLVQKVPVYNGDGRPCFVRFGDLNSNGSSINGQTMQYLSGHSCYEAREHFGVYYITIGRAGSSANTLITLMDDYYNKCREIFEVAGDVLEERGPDLEPLLKNAVLVKKLKIIAGEIKDPEKHASRKHA